MDPAAVAMVALSGSVALGYFVIALVVAPKIRMATASPRVLSVVRTAATVFFLGCGMTHVDVLVHTIGVGGTQRPIEGHAIFFHLAQAVGSWLFILGASLKLELHVVASDRTAKQRDVARAELAAERDVTAASHRGAARSTGLAVISELTMTRGGLTVFASEVATAVRHVLGDRCTVRLTEQAESRASGVSGPFFTVQSTSNCSAADRQFITSVNSVLRNGQLRLQLENELRFRSLHDPLTGLPNRVLLMDRLEQALARESRSDAEVSVLFIDLDGFKQVNDTSGHEAGDRLLVKVADRLRTVARKCDTVARQSGDEFVLVCEQTDGTTAAEIARRVTRSLSRPYPLLEGLAIVTASIGVATSHAACSAEELLGQADAAMYRAKQLGPGGVDTFVPVPKVPVIRL